MDRLEREQVLPGSNRPGEERVDSGRDANELMDSEVTLTDRLMSDMPPELLSFLKERVTSFVKLDLIRFLHENPVSRTTVTQIAEEIGLDEVSIEEVLQEMAAAGVVAVAQEGRGTFFRLTGETEQRRLVARFAEACEDSQFRTKVIFHIIRSMR
jgi:DNA-binding transcriptional ArsR family regulator